MNENIIVLIDYENNCQKFAPPEIILPRDLRQRLDVHLFVGTANKDVPVFDANDIRTVHQATTNAAEAADTELIWYAAQIEKSFRGKIILVHGCDSRWDHLHALLVGRFGKDRVQNLDGRGKTILDILPEEIVCVKCKTIVLSMWSHKYSQTCYECRGEFFCKTEKDAHCEKRQFIICQEVGCHLQHSCPKNRSHNNDPESAHPKCKDPKCHEVPRFRSPVEYSMHVRRFHSDEPWCNRPECLSKHSTGGDNETYHWHMRVNHPEIPFCIRCNRTFPSKSSRKRHNQHCPPKTNITSMPSLNS